MRRIAVLFLFGAICAGSALLSLHERVCRDNVRPVELYAVINRQVDALRVSDFPGAYRQVSSDFKRKCTMAQFTGMIHHEYSGLSEVDHVEYGAVECQGNRALIDVYFIDRRDRVIPCIYTLVHEGMDWKIEEVRLLWKKKAGLTLTGILS